MGTAVDTGKGLLIDATDQDGASLELNRLTAVFGKFLEIQGWEKLWHLQADLGVLQGFLDGFEALFKLTEPFQKVWEEGEQGKLMFGFFDRPGWDTPDRFVGANFLASDDGGFGTHCDVVPKGHVIRNAHLASERDIIADLGASRNAHLGD